jgi:hypothetical protein
MTRERAAEDKAKDEAKRRSKKTKQKDKGEDEAVCHKRRAGVTRMNVTARPARRA